MKVVHVHEKVMAKWLCGNLSGVTPQFFSLSRVVFPQAAQAQDESKDHLAQ